MEFKKHHRTVNAIMHMAIRYNLKCEYAYEKWSDKEDNLLISNSKSVSELTILTGRTELAIRSRRHILGLTHNTQKQWSSVEEQFILDNSNKLTVDELATQLGRSRSAVTHKIKKLGINLKIKLTHNWNSDAETFLIKNYQTKGAKFCATSLNKSIMAIYQKANELGLKTTYKTRSNECSIYCVELQVAYGSIAEAAKILNISASNISVALKNKNRTAGGYHWKYREEE